MSSRARPHPAPLPLRVAPMVLGLLILYGSLYPFDFVTPARDALTLSWSMDALRTSRGDLLGNVALFVPLAVAGVWAARLDGPSTWLRVFLAALALAVAAQVGQMFIASRDARAVDVAWNMVGVAVGLIAGTLWRRQSLARGVTPAGMASTQASDGMLLACCLAVAWMPLVPSLDLALIRSHVKGLLQPTAETLPDLGSLAALALFCAHVTARLFPSRPTAAPALACAAMAGMPFLIHGGRVSLAGLAGIAIGFVFWRALNGLRKADPATLCMAVLGLQTLATLAPFDFGGVPTGFSWLPFEAMLRGSMLANAQALTRDGWIWLAGLLLAKEAGGRVVALSIGLALWVLLLEAAQILSPSRSADVTPALVVLGLGLLSASWPQPERSPRHRPDGEPRGEPRGRSKGAEAGTPARVSESASWLAWWPLPVLALGLHFFLSLPSLPYNVAELFRDGGSLPSLFTFAAALLWLGAGGAWVGAWLGRTRHPGIWMPAAALACGLVSLGLLSIAVTEESVADIAGSKNLYFFVTQRDAWGPAWAAFFTVVGSDLVGFLERCARYAALYGPLPVFLGGAIAAHRILRGPDAQAREGRGRLLGLTLSSVATLWLCKAVAFDWSSTDNLNELIARDGPWGWGGGGYLYALLALICLNAWALSRASHRQPAWAWAAWLIAPVCALAGWWLLNHGLETQIRKYGLTYSGVQFLLGPDRRQLLDESQLLARWLALYLAAIVVLALGLRMHEKLHRGARGRDRMVGRRRVDAAD